MSVQVKPPENQKRETKYSSPPPSFSLLPDDITLNYLARIPRFYYPRLSTVSKSFRSLLSSTEILAERSHIGITEQCLYFSLGDLNSDAIQSFVFFANPNRTLPNSSMIKSKKRTMGWLLALPPFNIPCLAISIVVGSEIYVIGGEVDGARTSAVRIFDCRSRTWRDAPSMNVARHSYIYSCVYDGKIYVMGGCNDDEPWAEIFDTKTQTWELFQDPFKCWAYRMAEIQGKIYFQAADKMYAY